MKARQLLLLFIVLLHALFNHAWAKTEAEHWDDIGFSDFHARELFLSEKNCEESARKFSACLYALSMGLSLGKSKLILIEHTSRPSLLKSQTYRLVDDYTYGEVDENLERRESNKLIRAYLDQLEQDFGRLRKNNFERLIDTMIGRYKDLFQIEEAAGNYASMYNAYLNVYESSNSYAKPVSYLVEQNQQKSEYMFGFQFKEAFLNGKKVMELTNVYHSYPAQKKGLRVNDLIVSINGFTDYEKIKEITLAKNQPMDVVVYRNGKELTFHFELHELEVKNVEYAQMDRDGVRIDFIKIRGFMSKSTCSEVRALAEQAEQRKVQGLILDLRDNGGGYMDQAYCILSLFMRPGNIKQIKSVVNGRAQGVSYYTGQEVEQNFFSHIPVVTLINGNSASASEIVAGNLQVFAKGFLLGERSFGKGVFQAPSQYLTFNRYSPRKGMAVVYKHQGHYLLANGTSPQIDGLVPEFTVYPAIDQKQATDYLRMEDLIRPVPHFELKASKDLLNQARAQQVKACLNREYPLSRYLIAQTNISDWQQTRAMDVLACTKLENMKVVKGRSDYPKTYSNLGSLGQTSLKHLMAKE